MQCLEWFEVSLGGILHSEQVSIHFMNCKPHAKPQRPSCHWYKYKEKLALPQRLSIDTPEYCQWHARLPRHPAWKPLDYDMSLHDWSIQMSMTFLWTGCWETLLSGLGWWFVKDACATNIVVSLWLMHLASCSCTSTVKVAKYRIAKFITFVFQFGAIEEMLLVNLRKLLVEGASRLAKN